MKRYILTVAIFLTVPAFVLAQEHHEPQVSTGSTQARSLTESEVQGYLQGRGMGMAKAAELNSYPGPMHVLELADKLSLTDIQRRDTQRTFEAMRAEAIRIGKLIVEKEGDLNRLFAGGKAERVDVEHMVRGIAELHAKLRAVHLNAHLEMKRILSIEQIKTYDELRGNRVAGAVR
jgi:Spy/CpxP family protein refolding chaperone